MRTKLIVLTVMSLLFFLLANGQNNTLMGNWQATNGTIMNFSENNVSVGSDTYTYAIQGYYLSMYNQQGDILTYTYQVKANQLYLYLEGTGTYILTKVGNSVSTRAQERNTYNTNRQVAGARAERLYGSLCNYSSSGYSGSSSYSTTKRISFDGRGHYQYGSSSSYSGNGDGYSGGDGGYSGTYKVVGNKGVILTASDGSVYNVALESWEGSGEITGLKYDGVVYAKALCD